MTRYGQRENGHVPAYLALQTVTKEEAWASTSPLLALLAQARAEHGHPVELRARLDGDPDADLVWEPIPPGEEFPWIFADRDSTRLVDYTHADHEHDLDELRRMLPSRPPDFYCPRCGASPLSDDSAAFVCARGHRFPYPADTGILDAVLKELKP